MFSEVDPFSRSLDTAIFLLINGFISIRNPFPRKARGVTRFRGASSDAHAAPGRVCATVSAPRSCFTLQRKMYCKYVCSWHNIRNKTKQGFTPKTEWSRYSCTRLVYALKFNVFITKRENIARGSYAHRLKYYPVTK